MPDSDYNYGAVSCRAVRTFRLFRPLPLIVQFFSVWYSVELHLIPGTGYSEALVARLPWQDKTHARELDHAGPNVIERNLVTGYEVACGTLAEVLFLRLVRQGEAEELAGPHMKVPSALLAKIERAPTTMAAK